MIRPTFILLVASCVLMFVSSYDDFHEEFVHLASRSGQQDMKALEQFGQKAGAKMNDRDSVGNTPVHAAAQSGNERLLSTMIKMNRGKLLLSPKNNFGFTPLVLAQKNDRERVVKLLRRAIGDVSFRSIARAIRRRDLDELESLFFRGADFNERGPDGETLLMQAINRRSEYDVVTFLVEHGADTTLRSTNGETALFKAVHYGRLEIVQYLMENGAAETINVPARIKGIGTMTPLKAARRSRRREIVQYLEDQGAQLYGSESVNSNENEQV